MPTTTEPYDGTAKLLARGNATLLASWEAYARGARRAAVLRLEGVSAAVFPEGPERAVYNNALLEHEDAIELMEAAYGEIPFAAWVHESDPALRDALTARGYVLDTTTRAMGLELHERERPAVELAPAAWDEYLRVAELPDGV